MESSACSTSQARHSATVVVLSGRCIFSENQSMSTRSVERRFLMTGNVGETLVASISPTVWKSIAELPLVRESRLRYER